MAWWRIRKRNADVERELRSDIELEEEELREQGSSPEGAHYAALRSFGNPTLISEATREVWNWSVLETFLRDLRIGARALFRSPGFSITAVLVMALCIGATTSLFTVVRSVLLRPLPFRDPDRLVMVYEHFRDPSMNALQFNYNSVAPADYYDWRAQTNGFEDMAALRWWQFTLTGERGELPEIVSARGATWNLFSVLGVNPAIGRTFTESEDRLDGYTALITWSLFERRFGGDPAIVGKQIHLDAQPYTVIGVLPKWFVYPDANIQVWVPYKSGLPPAILEHHDFHFSRVVARLKPDVTLANALSQVEAAQYRLHMQNLNAPVAEDVVSRTLIQDLAQDVKRPLIVLLCAVACMLLIGCLNVANLMVARSAARQKEIAVRSALGAGRVTLIREQLVESLLVSFAGGVAGLLLSLAATKWLVTRWTDLPSAQSVHTDGVVIAFACALFVSAALPVGLLAAISSTGKQGIAMLQASSRSTAGSRSSTALRKALLMAEIATTVVLLIAAGLLLKNFWRLRTTDVGTASSNVLTLSYSLPMKTYDTPEKINAFNEALVERVSAMPGVTAAGLGSVVPGAGAAGDNSFVIHEHAPLAPGTALPDALARLADPGYFNTLQIPLLSGRVFTRQDRTGHPKTIVISHQLAQQYFPGEDPLGKHLHIAARGDADYEIVGIVADTLHQVGEPARATMYFPILNVEMEEGLTLTVRTATDPLSLAVPIQKEIMKLDPELPVSNVLTIQQIIQRSLGSANLSASLVLGFAMLSLLLASVGLYGVLSYLTTQRTGEIGIRMALGAQRSEVMRLILGDGLRPALYGLTLGLIASIWSVRLIQSMLSGTRPLDPAIFASVSASMLIVAVLACFVPAWRASQIDPMQALRGE
ncbi:MAG: ABC transporter permease [Candidatus Acidiferrales bacterium]